MLCFCVFLGLYFGVLTCLFSLFLKCLSCFVVFMVFSMQVCLSMWYLKINLCFVFFGCIKWEISMLASTGVPGLDVFLPGAAAASAGTPDLDVLLIISTSTGTPGLDALILTVAPHRHSRLRFAVSSSLSAALLPSAKVVDSDRGLFFDAMPP